MSRLARIMASAAKELAASIQKSRVAFDHNLTKGEAVEAAVREFFRSHYPESVGVAHGQVVDSKGNSSNQLDVILYDAAKTPVLFIDRENGQRLIPIEGVIAAVEAKTRLDLGDIPKLAESAATLKALDRSAYYIQKDALVQTRQKAYGSEWEVLPPMYFVLAFEGPTMDKLATVIEETNEGKPLHQRIDMACVLERGTTVNQDLDSRMIECIASPGTRVRGYETDKALLLFHILISRYVLQMRFPPIALQNYIPKEFIF